MKKAKKLLALLLTGLMVFAMTACGSGSGNGGSGSDNESDMEYVKDRERWLSALPISSP